MRRGPVVGSSIWHSSCAAHVKNRCLQISQCQWRRKAVDAMAEQNNSYEQECQRAELLGLQPPDKAEFERLRRERIEQEMAEQEAAEANVSPLCDSIAKKQHFKRVIHGDDSFYRCSSSRMNPCVALAANWMN